MKFINGKVFGSRQGLTRLPGIGQMYALRLEAVGYNQPADLLYKYLQLDSDENQFKTWLKTTCRAVSNHAEKCALEIKRMHLIEPLERPSLIYNQWPSETRPSTEFYFFHMHNQHLHIKNDAIVPNVMSDTSVSLQSKCNDAFYHENKLNRFWDTTTERQPSNILNSYVETDCHKFKILPDGDILEPYGNFEMKFATTINDANKKLHELQSDLSNINMLHREYRTKHDKNHEHELQSICRKISLNVDNIIFAQTKFSDALLQLDGQIKMLSSNDLIHQQVHSLQKQMHKMDGLLKKVIDKTDNMEFVLHRESLLCCHKLEQVICNTFDKKFMEMNTKFRRFERKYMKLGTSISFGAMLLIYYIYLRIA